MIYSVKWSSKALNGLRKLPTDIAKRIVKKVNITKNNPKHFLESLTGDSGYKLRAGDYRVIVDIIEKEKIIAIRVVGHRKTIYKRNL